MTEKQIITLPQGKDVSPKINRTSDRLGELIDNGFTERVYKNLKTSHIKI